MDSVNLANVTDQLATFLSTYGLRVIGAIVILIIGRIAAGLMASGTRKALRKAKADESLIGFLASLVKVAVIVFTVIAALSKFGVQTTSFVAVLGAAGLAVGLALQGSLSNFAAGVLLLVFKPFRVGDVIDAAGVVGSVKDIGIFTTTLHAPDNKKIIVPNSSITGGTITNINANETRRVDLTAGIGYGDDIGKAMEILQRILREHPNVLEDPASTVEVSELADSSVNFVVRPWVKTADYWRVYFDVTRSIKEEFDKVGISIPYPQQDVHMFQESAT